MSEQVTNGDTRSPRLTQWMAFLIFSTITLGSAAELANRTKGEVGGGRENQHWAVACSSITFAMTLIVVLMHLHSLSAIYIVGTKIEGMICVILFALWVSVVTIVSDSRNGLAVDDKGTVSNANLYYFSWAGFICSITLLVSYLRSAFNVDLPGEIRARSARLNLWSGLLATSIVVVGSSATIFDSTCSLTMGSTYCKRTVLGITMGAISCFMALYVVGMKIATSKAPFWVEAIFSLLLFISYIFGVSFITSSYGPGAPLGNLYYFTWISFLLSFLLLASCFEDYQAAKAVSAQRDPYSEGDENDINVESLDDNL